MNDMKGKQECKLWTEIESIPISLEMEKMIMSTDHLFTEDELLTQLALESKKHNKKTYFKEIRLGYKAPQLK